MSVIANCPSNLANLVKPLNSAATVLLNRFCACPAATQFLSEKIKNIAHPLFLDVQQEASYPRSDFSFDKKQKQLLSATIVIPKRIFKTPEALTKLTFEFSNCAYQKWQEIEDQAKKGDLGVDAYAHGKERLELENIGAHDALVTACKKAWKIDKIDDSLMQDQEAPQDPEKWIWESDFMCHTDVARNTWLKLYQKGYCKKHPEDERSCQMKQTDLCDFDAFNKASVSERGAIMVKRICERLLEAPQKVQEEFLSIVQAHCPHVLDKRKKTEL